MDTNKYPIVILPGWMLGSARFEPLALLLQKQGFKTYVLDFPGFDTGEDIFRPWTLSDYVAYVQKYLRDKKIEKAIFICHSFGGRVALKLLSQSPQLARALVLTGTPGYRSLHTTRLQIIATITKLGKAFMALPPLSIFEDFIRNIYQVIVGARDLKQLKGFMRQTFINIVEEDLELYMKKITIPTLLLWGKDDGLVSVGIAEKMQQVIKHSKLIVIADSRHNIIYRQPDIFADEVISFLKKL